MSEQSLLSLEEIFIYGIETFSFASSSIFLDELNLQIQSLSKDYLHHPECRYLTKKYRNIRYGSYLVIYKITISRIEVLNIIHASRSISRIKAARKIKL
jgi:toxin ParE1/3/4